MAGTDLPALPGASRGRGATVGRDFADRQRLAAVLDGSVGLGDVHGRWGGRVGGDGQGAMIGVGQTTAAVGRPRRVQGAIAGFKMFDQFSDTGPSRIVRNREMRSASLTRSSMNPVHPPDVRKYCSGSWPNIIRSSGSTR